MTRENKVVRSVNAEGESRCVDIFRRPDGSFGFEEYRREPEDGRGWFPTGFHDGRIFPSETEALNAARDTVPWLAGAMDAG